MDKIKRSKVERLRTEAIRTILGNLSGPELKDPSPEFPLGGMVHIDGIGQVTVEDLRTELARREQ